MDLRDLRLPRFSGPPRGSRRLSWQREREGGFPRGSSRTLGDPPWGSLQAATWHAPCCPIHNTTLTRRHAMEKKSSKTTKHGRTSKTKKSQRRSKKTGVAGESSGIARKLLGNHQGLPGIAGGSRAPGWALTVPQSGTGHGHHGTPPPRHGSHPAPSLHRPIYLICTVPSTNLLTFSFLTFRPSYF